MKSNHPPEDEGRFRELLATWKVDATPPPRFQERVWQRIEHRETQPAAGQWTQLLREMAAALARPRWAVSYVAVLLGLRLMGRLRQGRARHQPGRQELGG